MSGQPAWIDSDAHILESTDVWKYLDKEYRDKVHIRYMTEDPEIRESLINIDVHIDGSPIPIWIAGDRASRFERLIPSFKAKYKAGAGWDPKQYLADLDVEGITKGVMYPTLFLWAPWIPAIGAKFSQALCRAYNDWIHDFCSISPKRLCASACISLHDVDGAIKEAKRAADRGFVGVFVRPNPMYGRTLGHQDYFPLWKVCEDLGLTVGIHEGQLSHLPTLGQDRTRAQWGIHTMSHPFEQMAAMLTMIEYGVFDAFPKLNFLFLEAGTALWLPYWLNRLDAARHLYRGSGKGELLPSEYFARQGFVTCEVDDPYLPATLMCVSDKKLLMSTDYPHMESPYPNSMKKFVEQKISTESRDRIGFQNALDAYPRLRG